MPAAAQRVEALLLQAAEALERRLVQPALTALAEAAGLAPGRADVQAQTARAHSLRGEHAAALAAAGKALARLPQAGPGDALTLDTLGVVFSRANDHARAAEVYRRAVALAPQSADFHFHLASTLKFLGDFEGSAASYGLCLHANPHYWQAYYARSQLRRATIDCNHLAELQARLADAAQDPDALLRLHLTLAKECEDLGQHAEMFQHLLTGKAARRAALRYEFARDDAPLFAALMQAPIRAESRGHDSREPIFVLGLPRTGTTLVERILSSHPAVHSAGELQNFAACFKRASGTRPPLMLDLPTIAASARIDWPALGAAYLQSTRPATGHSAHFVDKMPLNFLYIGAIHQALPQAKIVCLRRHPLDAVLGNFKQMFSLNFPYYRYSYDLLDCARYVLAFERLMQHWRAALPGVVLELEYEKLVTDAEGQTRCLLAHCGLEWDAACLHFERNSQPVATASAVQVRSGISSAAVGRWRLYERELLPARRLLEAGGIDCG